MDPSAGVNTRTAIAVGPHGDACCARARPVHRRSGRFGKVRQAGSLRATRYCAGGSTLRVTHDSRIVTIEGDKEKDIDSGTRRQRILGSIFAGAG